MPDPEGGPGTPGVANATTNPLYGGLLLPTDVWLVQYDCITGGVSVEPPEHSTPWVEAKTGHPEITAENGTLHLVTLHPESIEYSKSLPTLSNVTGCFAEAVVRVATSQAGADLGALLEMEATSAGAAVCLRATGVNLLGEANVAVDMTRWRTVVLGLDGTTSTLWVDGKVMQESTILHPTCGTQVYFGASAIGGSLDVTWRYVRVRAAT